MTKLRKDALKYPVFHLLIVVCLGMGLASLPVSRIFESFIADKAVVIMASTITTRVILSALALFFIFRYGFYKSLSPKLTIIGHIAVIPALLVAINNFPVYGVLKGTILLTPPSESYYVIYAFYCLSIGLFEEITFRGLVFPLCVYIFRKSKYDVFWATFTSSAVFGLVHLLNLFGGASVGETILQVGYSFLVGAMCALSVALTKSIYSAILIHAVYDVGGLLCSKDLNMVSGVNGGAVNQWDSVTVTVTAVLGVITAIYMIIVCFKLKKGPLLSLYGFDAENIKSNVEENSAQSN